jgi:hypothetical protein
LASRFDRLASPVVSVTMSPRAVPSTAERFWIWASIAAAETSWLPVDCWYDTMPVGFSNMYPISNVVAAVVGYCGDADSTPTTGDSCSTRSDSMATDCGCDCPVVASMMKLRGWMSCCTT